MGTSRAVNKGYSIPPREEAEPHTAGKQYHQNRIVSGKHASSKVETQSHRIRHTVTNPISRQRKTRTFQATRTETRKPAPDPHAPNQGTPCPTYR